MISAEAIGLSNPDRKRCAATRKKQSAITAKRAPTAPNIPDRTQWRIRRFRSARATARPIELTSFSIDAEAPLPRCGQRRDINPTR